MISSNSEIAGIAILKISENKINTFYILPGYRRKHLSNVLMYHCLQLLDAAKISVPKHHLVYWENILKLYGFVQYQQDQDNLYYCTDKVVEEYELFGWSIIDKYGVCSRTIYKKRHYFGSIEEKDSVDYPDEVLDEVNRHHAGLAPHTIEELYIKKRERLFFDTKTFA